MRIMRRALPPVRRCYFSGELWERSEIAAIPAASLEKFGSEQGGRRGARSGERFSDDSLSSRIASGRRMRHEISAIMRGGTLAAAVLLANLQRYPTPIMRDASILGFQGMVWATRALAETDGQFKLPRRRAKQSAGRFSRLLRS